MKGQEETGAGGGCIMGGIGVTSVTGITVWGSEDLTSTGTGAASCCVSLSESISISPAKVISSLLVGSEVAVCWARSNSSTRSLSLTFKDSR